MELAMDYQTLRTICIKLGRDKFFNMFCDMYKNLDFYTMSVDWMDNKQYILKFKGSCGDLIVSWKTEEE